MSITRVKVENLAKQYRLGEVGTGTLSHDLNRFWHKVRGKEDPYSIVTDVNDRTQNSGSEYVWALQDINFEVKEGEVLGIIGRNGAGKSTLLKLLSKVTGPTKGEIKLSGRIGSLLEVGTGMHPELTGKENIYLNGAILGMTKAEVARKFDEIVEFAGIGKYINTPFKRYSSGMRVRLGFAVAAFLEPEILIVDEVLAVGDAEFQKKAIGKMQEVSDGEGRTVLFVSHNMGSIKSLCTRSILMDNGQIVYDGDTKTCIDKYLSANKSEQGKSLKDIETRTGNGKLKFSGYRLFNENSEEIKLEPAVDRWKKLIGLMNPEEATAEDPECLRAIYGVDIIKNAFHGADNNTAANKERDIFLFPIPERPPEFEYIRTKIPMEMILKFLYPPNLEHANSTGRLDLLALYGPIVNHHSVD